MPARCTKSASSLRGTGKLKRRRYDMMRRLLRTREFFSREGRRLAEIHSREESKAATCSPYLIRC